MTDLETRLRETFDRHADRAELPVVTPALLGRARRRLARTVVVSAVSVLALTGLGVWSVQTATAEPVRPVHRPVVPDPAAHNGDLAYVAGPLDAARLVIRHRDGSVSSIDRTRIETEPCTPYPVVTMIEGTPRCGGFGSLVWAPDGGAPGVRVRAPLAAPGQRPAPTCTSCGPTAAGCARSRRARCTAASCRVT